MLKKLFIFSILLYPLLANAATPLSPEEYLGYPLGSRFTPHHRIVDYFRSLSESSDRITLKNYGSSIEGRPLLAAVVSSPENLARLDAIQKSNRVRAGLEEGEMMADQPALVWLSYGIHGNESASSEVALQVLYELTRKNTEIDEWLKNLVVVIDPCLNPDGRSRYVNWYQEMGPMESNPDPDHWSHHERWPGGRGNHYLFDLNRDWVWQVQPESTQRLKLYNQWLPQIHVDFHEQGINEPYYFAPAAEPFHQLITEWQRDFQQVIGTALAEKFDRNHWLYFTREKFDLFYPGFGDTYPLFNGSIGMTYEQGGSGRAGLAVLTETQDTLTLKDRIDHHLTTSMETIKVASAYRQQLLKQFGSYFSYEDHQGKLLYQTFIVKSKQSAKLKPLIRLLELLEIEYGFAAQEVSVTGYNYHQHRAVKAKVNVNDLVIDTKQPKHVLLQVLFDPSPVLTDSNSYDITSWSLPYVFGVEGLAVKENRSIRVKSSPTAATEKAVPEGRNYAYLVEWSSFEAAKALSYLIRENVKVRYSQQSIHFDGRIYPEGSLLITQADNKNRSDLGILLQDVASQFGIEVVPVNSGMLPNGPDLGSSAIELIKKPEILLAGGDGIQNLRFGETWFYFEQQLEFPFKITYLDDLHDTDLEKYNVLIFPSGDQDLFRNEVFGENIKEWVRAGNKLILLENSINSWLKACDCSLTEKKLDPEKEKQLIAPEDRNSYDDKLEGSIVKLKLDPDASLAYGLGDSYFSMRTSEKYYEWLPRGQNVAVTEEENLISGLAGRNARIQMQRSLVFGIENYGKGKVYYLVDNPIFRGFWQDGLLLFANAVFFDNR